MLDLFVLSPNSSNVSRAATFRFKASEIGMLECKNTDCSDCCYTGCDPCESRDGIVALSQYRLLSASEGKMHDMCGVHYLGLTG
jgi:hypothetical protein